MAGTSLVYRTKEEDILIDPFKVPEHWPRMFALDIGDEASVCWAAHDTEEDVLYIYADYRQKRSDIAVHASAIQERGSWIPGVFSPRARGRDAEAGDRVVSRLQKLTLDIVLVDEVGEEGVEETRARFETKRLRVFSNLRDWLTQYRGYYRDDKGKIIEEQDGLMKATQNIVYNAHLALDKGYQTTEKPEDLEYGYEDCDTTTGY